MMRLIMACLLAMCASGCATLTAPPPSPAAIADATVLDERGAIAVEQAYAAAALLLETAVDARLIEGQAARTASAIESRAWTAVQTVRAAYRSGNAESYAGALTDARAALADLFGALGRTTGQGGGS